ncbi:hypothetical protein, partial [Sinorhizobium meliloti]
LPCKSPDSPGNLLARPASLKIQPIQWGGDGAYAKDPQWTTEHLDRMPFAKAEDQEHWMKGLEMIGIAKSK